MILCDGSGSHDDAVMKEARRTNGNVQLECPECHVFVKVPVQGGKSIGEVYQERNLLALAFVLSQPEGWIREDGWPIIGASTPEGQVSWHVPPRLVSEMDLPSGPEYDGHDLRDKLERLGRLIE